MAGTVPWGIRSTPAVRDAFKSGAKRAGMSEAQWLEHLIECAQGVHSVHMCTEDVHTSESETPPAQEQSGVHSVHRDVHMDVHSVHTPQAEGAQDDVRAIASRWKQLFPQAEITRVTVDLWLSMADTATIQRMLTYVDKRITRRAGPGVARYASKVLEGFVENPLPPKTVTVTQTTTDKEPITDRDRARWAAVDAHIAKYGSPWPDWDKIEAEKQAEQGAKGDE